MRLPLSTSGLAALGAVWISSITAAEARNSSALPPPYPDTRTLVKLHPAAVDALEDPDYNLWQINGNGALNEFSANGLDFTIKATTGSDTLVGDAFQVYTQPFPDVGQRLIGSGITTDSSGGSITLTITGLEAGEHWLSTWHNSWEDLDDIPSVQLIIDGTSGISVSTKSWTHLGELKTHANLVFAQGRPTTSQETNRYGTALIHSWTVFTSDGGTTEVEYKPRDGNMYLNGFEIDSESMGRQIRFPKPAHRDQEVDAPGGTVSASWERTFNVDGDQFNV